MSTHNIGFHIEISKIIPQLSSNMHLIYSSDALNKVALLSGFIIINFWFGIFIKLTTESIDMYCVINETVL